MSTVNSEYTPTPHPDFASYFNAALASYEHKTKNDLASDPLLPKLQSCESAEAILSVFRERIPLFDKSEDRFTKWIIPTVKVLHAFSDVFGQVVGLAFPPANIVFAGINVLFSAAEDASACWDKLIDVFNRIECFFKRLEIYTDIMPTTAMMDVIVKIMIEVLTILGILTKELKRGRFKRYFRKLMKMTDIEDSLAKLDKLTLEEAWIISAEQLKVTHSVDETVKGIEGEVRSTRSNMQDVGSKVEGVGESLQSIQDDVKDVGTTMRIVGNDIKGISSEFRDVGDKLGQVNRNQLRDSLLRWLSAPDPSTNHNIAREVHHCDTSQWFFEAEIFNQWKSQGSLLWIHGKPGSGKTVLCSSIIKSIEPLHHTGAALMAKFYFDGRDANKQNLRNLLPSLLIQLSAQSNACCDILSQLYSEHDHGVEKPSNCDMVECLIKMLLFEKQVPIYIIMDALDECPVASAVPPLPRQSVLEILEKLVGLHLPNLHICVTSRPAHDIRVSLERLTEHLVSLHDESGQQEDIAKYVAYFVHSDQRMQRWPEEYKDLVIKTLSEKANGMFRWTFCQLDVLRHCFLQDIRRTLDDLPESLDETYERILREIQKPNREHAHRILQCLVAADRPLRVKELADVLAFDFDRDLIPKMRPNWRGENKEEAIMSTCSNLVVIVRDRHRRRIVQFSHFSVKEFLMSNRLAEPIRDVSRYYILPDDAHTILARACLGVLLRLKSGITNHYAAEHWWVHAMFGDVPSRIRGGVRCLLDANKPYFSQWIRRKSSHYTPLFIVAFFGLCDVAEHIIAEYPEQINSKIEDGTPLHGAAIGGYPDMISLLLKHGANLEAWDVMEQTPLHRAAGSGTLEAGRSLLDHGADINPLAFLDITPIFTALLHKKPEFVQMLIERGAMRDIVPLPFRDAAPNLAIRALEEYYGHGVEIPARVFELARSFPPSGIPLVRPFS